MSSSYQYTPNIHDPLLPVDRRNVLVNGIRESSRIYRAYINQWMNFKGVRKP